MDEKRISVGIKYKEVFDSVIGLVKKNALPNFDIKVTNNEIHSKQKVFVLDDNHDHGSDEVDSIITKTGASWFGVFRNQPIDTSDSEWIDFVNEISESYHKEYTFFEYPKIGHKKSESEITQEKRILGSILKTFFESVYNDLRLIETTHVKTQILGVNLRLEINRGTGALQPLMARVYFEKNIDGTLTPIASNIVDEIEVYFKQSLASSGVNKINSSIEETEKLSNQVCASLDNLINNRSIMDFSDCIYVSSQEDVDIMEEIIRRGSAGVLDISCTNVRILSIILSQWENQVYHIGKDNTSLLEFSFNLDNSLSLKCMNCNDTIIDNNVIQCILPETNEKVDITIDFDKVGAKPYLGLTNDEIQKIKANGPFKNHLFENSCTISTRNIKCNRNLCSKQIINNGKEKICKNCPYPEKLYINRAGVKIITSLADFDRDTLELVSKDKLKKCKLCNRPFQFINNNGYCTLCDLVVNNNHLLEIKPHKVLYKKYAGIIPLKNRLFRVKNKLAFEDDEVVIIVVGNKKFLFKKIGISERGYIKSDLLKKLE